MTSVTTIARLPACRSHSRTMVRARDEESGDGVPAWVTLLIVCCVKTLLFTSYKSEWTVAVQLAMLGLFVGRVTRLKDSADRDTVCHSKVPDVEDILDLSSPVCG